jgi:hypothetical protein
VLVLQGVDQFVQGVELGQVQTHDRRETGGGQRVRRIPEDLLAGVVQAADLLAEEGGQRGLQAGPLGEQAQGLQEDLAPLGGRIPQVASQHLADLLAGLLQRHLQGLDRAQELQLPKALDLGLKGGQAAGLRTGLRTGRDRKQDQGQEEQEEAGAQAHGGAPSPAWEGGPS